MNHYTPRTIGEGTPVPNLEKPAWELIFDYECQHCGNHRNRRIYGPHPGGHFARIECDVCDRFMKWEGKPKSSTQKPSRKDQSKLLDRYSKGFCELCLRKGIDLPLPQVLEAHHVIPVASGGSNDLENIQIVCTACHRLIHHQRVYLGHYTTAAIGGVA